MKEDERANSKNWFKRHPAWTTVVVFMAVGIISSAIIDHKNFNGETGVQTKVESQATPAPKAIPYEVVSRWNLGDGIGEDIVISTNYLNQADMVALGETLKNDLKSYSDAVAVVYTDKKAAAMKNEIDKPDATKAEMDFYDNHHVAMYNKNPYTHYHNYDFGLNGFGEEHDTIINY